MSPLEIRILQLEQRLNSIEKSDRLIIFKNMEFLDGRKIQLGTKTGTTFGTSALQKIGFYGHAPIAQQTAAQPYTAPDIGGILKNLGLLTT